MCFGWVCKAIIVRMETRNLDISRVKGKESRKNKICCVRVKRTLDVGTFRIPGECEKWQGRLYMCEPELAT